MIVVFGSSVLDLVMPVPALPVPGQTVLCDGYIAVPGGKGANQALAARRAGGDVAMVGCVGDDHFGRIVLQPLRDEGVDLESFTIERDTPTSCACVCVNPRGENQIVVASGANQLVTAKQLHPMQRSDVLLLQMEISLEQNWLAIHQARTQGARVILNAAPAAAVPEVILRQIDVLIVNEVESQFFAQMLGLPDVPAALAARELCRRYGCVAVVTLGEKGAVAYDRCFGPNGSTQLSGLQVSALPVMPVDTVGAGDAFVGAFACAYASGSPISECICRGSVAGSLACVVRGAQPSMPTAKAVQLRMDEVVVTPVDESNFANITTKAMQAATLSMTRVSSKGKMLNDSV
eukprot:jgi/Chlat1/738/Chrsp104S01219